MQLRWSPAAAEDLFRIVEYIRQENAPAAQRIAKTIYEKHGSKDPPLHGARSFPRSRPGRHCRGTCDPIDGLATGERKFLRTCAKLLANGIPPDVAGDILDPVRGPQNMVVITHFPETAAMRFAKRKGGALFEDADEFAQVRTVVKALGKNVRMVRHQAISMATGTSLWRRIAAAEQGRFGPWLGFGEKGRGGRSRW